MPLGEKHSVHESDDLLQQRAEDSISVPIGTNRNWGRLG
jgi:hypothetical protein